MTCLLVWSRGVKEFFAVFKGVGDVLAGRGAGFEVYFVVSRASVTCLLAVVEELFAVVQGVGDVLTGRGAGC